jgi:hypothetical protein
MKKLLLLLFSVIISFSSYAEWTYIGKDDDGEYSYYIDLQTLRKIDGYVYYWNLIDYDKPNEFGNMSGVRYAQGDCGITRSKNLTSVSYKKPMGEEVDDTYTEPNPEWEYVTPYTVGEFLLDTSCSLVDASYEEQQVIIEELLSYEREQYEQLLEQEAQDLEDLIENQKTILKAAWVNNIAAEVKSVWNFPGAEDGWFVEVLVTQDKEGKVLNVKLGDNNVGNSVIAKRFIDSIERAVYKASPLPISPDASVWDKDIMFTFYP